MWPQVNRPCWCRCCMLGVLFGSHFVRPSESSGPVASPQRGIKPSGRRRGAHCIVHCSITEHKHSLDGINHTSRATSAESTHFPSATSKSEVGSDLHATSRSPNATNWLGDIRA